LRCFGWKPEPRLPEGVHRSVMVAAPHSSNWDAFFMIVVGYSLGLRFRFAIKKEWLRFPMGLLLRPLGAIGLDRTPREPNGERLSQVEAMARLFEENEKLTMMIAPEGTRSNTQRWRTGFYHTALMAGVPITTGFLDYRRKVGGVSEVFQLTGDADADIARIKRDYINVMPKNPEKSLLWKPESHEDPAKNSQA